MRRPLLVCSLLLAACEPTSSPGPGAPGTDATGGSAAGPIDGGSATGGSGGSAPAGGGGTTGGGSGGAPGGSGGAPGGSGGAPGGDAGGTTGTDAGGVPAGDAGGATGDAGPGDGCPITGDSYYVLGGASLFRATPDGHLAELVAMVRTPSGGTVGSPVSTVKTGNWLVLSSPDCHFCKVDPAKVVNGEVNAEVIDGAVSPGLLGNSTEAEAVLLVSGLKVSVYSLGTNSILRTVGITLGKTGVYCNELLDIEGAVSEDGTYDVKVLAKCGDGSGGTFPTYAQTNGTFTQAPPTTTQDKFTVIAAAQASATTDAKLIERMDGQHEVFVGPPNLVFKLDGQGGFVRDTMHPFRQCTKAGTAVVAPPIF